MSKDIRLLHVTFSFSIAGKDALVQWENLGKQEFKGHICPRVYRVSVMMPKISLHWQSTKQCNLSNSMDFLKDAIADFQKEKRPL